GGGRGQPIGSAWLAGRRTPPPRPSPASGGGSIDMAERKAGQSPGGATDGLGARGTLTAWCMPRLAAGPAGPAALPDGARDATEGSALDVCAVPRTSPAMSLPPPLAGEGRGGGGRARPPLDASSLFAQIAQAWVRHRWHS